MIEIIKIIELMQKTEPLTFTIADWNDIKRPMDKEVWDRLNKNFWLDTAFPISDDLKSWHTLSEDEKWLVMRVFAGLTLLDTLQGHVGAPSLAEDATTDQEIAVFRQIAFMEEVHAKSYSTIFQTLAGTSEINRVKGWAEANEALQEKARIIYRHYKGDSSLKKKVASTLLESFLFYSGFFLPLWLNGQGKLTNTADLIKFIIRDEAVHGFYIGYLLQEELAKETPAVQAEITDWTYELLEELYDNEVKYTQDLYDDHGLTEEVKKFLRYNGNKALMNLGMDPLFPTNEQVNPIVLNSLGEESETHDFFSTTGSYVMGDKEETTDEDWSDNWDDDEDF